MNSNKKKITSIIASMIFIMFIVLNTVYAEPTKYVQEVVVEDFEEINPMVKTVVGSAWASISLVVQVLAVLCIVITGLRYMFASSDKKADIKAGAKLIAIGCALVFVAVPIIQVVVKIFNDII